jgi:glucoamylase
VPGTALTEGETLAKSLGTKCDGCAEIAPLVLCHLQEFWSRSPSGDYIVSNSMPTLSFPVQPTRLSRRRQLTCVSVDTDARRTGKDANSILGSIHNFDPSAGCERTTFQPCSDRALANHKAVTDSFRDIYGINEGIPPGKAVAVGRYAEDRYFGGNPWYLATLAAAEQLYDALYVWETQRYIEITATSLPFFTDLVSSATIGHFYPGTEGFDRLHSAVSAYADGYLDLVATFAQANGSLSEQFSRDDGTPLSAYDLTWSYAAFLTAAARRARTVPASWLPSPAPAVPGNCVASSVIGSYSSATATSFPESQTPKHGVPSSAPSTATATSGAPSTTTASPCTTATSVAVTFNEHARTRWGQTVKIVGNISALGDWDPNRAVELSAAEYTSDNPVWKVTVTLEAGAVIEYKYIRTQSDPPLFWEADPNHTYTVPRSCETELAVYDRWQY